MLSLFDPGELLVLCRTSHKQWCNIHWLLNHKRLSMCHPQSKGLTMLMTRSQNNQTCSRCWIVWTPGVCEWIIAFNTPGVQTIQHLEQVWLFWYLVINAVKPFGCGWYIDNLLWFSNKWILHHCLWEIRHNTNNSSQWYELKSVCIQWLIEASRLDWLWLSELQCWYQQQHITKIVLDIMAKSNLGDVLLLVSAL